MRILNRSSLQRKVIIGIFIIINFILAIAVNVQYTLMFQINFIVSAYFAFGEKFILAFGFFIFEIAAIWSLFVDKSIYKLICNIILQIMCIADIYYCVFYMIKQTESIACVFEIIINVVFMCLILFDIVKSYKEKPDERFYNMGHDFLG